MYPCKPQFYCIKVGFKEVYIARTCFPNGEIDGQLVPRGKVYTLLTDHLITG